MGDKKLTSARVTFFPVGNGDATFIEFTDDETMLIDCNICEAEDDQGNETRFDVKNHILERVKKDDKKRPHFGIFAVTHPDTDHCRGFDKHFYQGDPSKYDDDDLEADLIIMDEMWFAPRIFAAHENNLGDDAKALKAELERRRKLHEKKDEKRNDPGNRLRCIGFSDNEKLDGLEEITTAPGKYVTQFNNVNRDDFRCFIFAPLKKDSDDKDGERNDTSIALSAEFKIDRDVAATRLNIYGDATRAILERIFDQNEQEDRLKYDLMLAPHHVSWHVFSDESEDDENAKVSSKVKSMVKKGRKGAIVVASSKPIKKGERPPPSWRAAELYRELVGKDNFICTEEYPTEKDPKPLVYEVTKDGPMRVSEAASKKQSASAISDGIANVITTPKTYG